MWWVDVAEVALSGQAAWLRYLAAAGYPQVLAGEGFAVATGVASNSENGAVIARSVLDRGDELDTIVDWLRDQAVPASVIVTAQPSQAAVARLLDRGLTPENTGHHMGRRLTDADARPGELATALTCRSGTGRRSTRRLPSVPPHRSCSATRCS